MRTKLDPDDEFFIPDVSGLDWSKAQVGRPGRRPGEKTEICIDGAIGYSLRLIPSNKILARFDSTLEAWPAIIATVEGGRSPRTLPARGSKGLRGSTTVNPTRTQATRRDTPGGASPTSRYRDARRSFGEVRVPTVHRFGPYRFYFFSEENDASHEPPHIHVRSGNGVASFWLAPIRIRDFQGYTPREVERIRRIVVENHDLLLRRWHEFFDKRP